MEALGINLGYLITQILGIIVLLLVLKHFIYAPILRMLDERKARIAKGLEDARQAAIARDNADAEAKKILDAARAEAAKIRQDAVLQAEETAKSIENGAHQEAKSILAGARDDAAEERTRILSDLRGQVAAISIAAANKIVGESLDEKRQMSDTEGCDEICPLRRFSQNTRWCRHRHRCRSASYGVALPFRVSIPSTLAPVLVRCSPHALYRHRLGFRGFASSGHPSQP